MEYRYNRLHNIATPHVKFEDEQYLPIPTHLTEDVSDILGQIYTCVSPKYIAYTVVRWKAHIWLYFTNIILHLVN